MEAMKDVGSQRVIASHKVGFRKKLEITDKGIRLGKLNIPYNLIKECNLYRNHYGVPDRCGMKYIDKSGPDKHISLGGHSLAVWRDIMRVSEEQGYRIPQQPHGDLDKWARRLRRLGIESEFIGPEYEHCTQSNSSWQRDLGGLRLSGSRVHAVNIRETGTITAEQVWAQYGSYTVTKVDTLYRFDYIIQVQPTRDAACYGKPVRKFLGRTVDYEWGSGELPREVRELPREVRPSMTLAEILRRAKLSQTETREERDSSQHQDKLSQSRLAQRLNEDAHLRKMLVKARAPAIEIGGNHIRIQDKKFPSSKLFQCIDSIAEYVRKQASQ